MCHLLLGGSRAQLGEQSGLSAAKLQPPTQHKAASGLFKQDEVRLLLCHRRSHGDLQS